MKRESYEKILDWKFFGMSTRLVGDGSGAAFSLWGEGCYFFVFAMVWKLKSKFRSLVMAKRLFFPL